MLDARAKSNRDDFDLLLIEAGTVARNWRSPTHRSHAAREARLAYIPSTDQIGEPKFQCAIALRALLRAIDSVDADARSHIVAAISATLAALRTEPSRAGPAVRRVPTDANSNWWTDT